MLAPVNLWTVLHAVRSATLTACVTSMPAAAFLAIRAAASSAPADWFTLSAWDRYHYSRRSLAFWHRRRLARRFPYVAPSPSFCEIPLASLSCTCGSATLKSQ